MKKSRKSKKTVTPFKVAISGKEVPQSNVFTKERLHGTMDRIFKNLSSMTNASSETGEGIFVDDCENLAVQVSKLFEDKTIPMCLIVLFKLLSHVDEQLQGAIATQRRIQESGGKLRLVSPPQHDPHFGEVIDPKADHTAIDPVVSSHLGVDAIENPIDSLSDTERAEHAQYVENRTRVSLNSEENSPLPKEEESCVRETKENSTSD